MLLIIACFMLFLTFGIWLGIPIFIILVYLTENMDNMLLACLIVPISVGLFVSLYFLPINIKVARSIAHIKQCHSWKIFLRVESIFVLMTAIIFILTVYIFLLANKIWE